MEVSRGAKDDELGVVPKYLYNDKIMIIDNREEISKLSKRYLKGIPK